MRILVTGAAGFIGSYYVRAMLDGEYPGFTDAKITVVDKLTYAGNRANLPASHPRLEFVQADICQQSLLLELVDGHDAVVHFAAESHVDRSLVNAGDFVSTNVLGTQNLMHACLTTGVARVVHVSTDEVYGSIEQGAWTEEWPLSPNSPYAASKAASDLIALSYARTHGLDVSVTRCSNNYGPYQHVEKLIPLFVTNLLSGEPAPLYGDGSHVREWLHVSDHCRAVQLVLTSGRAGEVYNIGGGTERTNRQIAEELVRLCGAGPEMIRRVPDRKGHDRRYALDDSKIRAELGYAPQVPFEEGLAATVAWYRDHPDWWKPLRESAGTVRESAVHALGT
ncbi:dTDP-glucose 4,6-dehydratase [Thermomonospora sp. CIF 1]|uniref:dTDP-glucose 4,6-dehydratase n=1 Tax=Thermomonospora sp. CIF 1 TaxID=1916083 RepID=UPI000AA5472D|nr:dTDP-glucose 4,6-dehydratase [Thermomonospora sp. CIF 1]PKK13509.1 MAG: dTDP-glucose 4,6-dehydratase [Thermomonospora sp. CIF 1]